MKKVSTKGKYENYQWSASKYGHRFDLTFEEFKHLAAEPCSFCEIKPSENVDRHQPNLGYTAENCLSCCAVCKAVLSKVGVEGITAWIENIKGAGTPHTLARARRTVKSSTQLSRADQLRIQRLENVIAENLVRKQNTSPQHWVSIDGNIALQRQAIKDIQDKVAQ